MRHSRRPWIRLGALVCTFALLAAACATEGDSGADDEDDRLIIGYLLPETGQLAFLGPPMIQGVSMAIAEMEEAGGPRGLEIELLSGDEAGDAAVAAEAANRLLADGVDAVVGAAASGMTLAVIDQITGAGVVECSPSNTSPTFTDYDDGGFYFRTAPTDALQGPVLAQVVREDGHDDIAILARADDYGRGLANAAADALTAGGANVVLNETYDPEASTFDAEATAASGAEPDAVIVVAFEEGQEVIRALIEAGISPANMYGTDGIRSETLSTDIDPGNPNVVDGLKGTAPDPGAVEGFLGRLAAFDPSLEETIFAPQSYDCAMLIGLAVVAADSTDPADFAGEIVGLTRGENECTGFEECADLLEAGETIDYQFVSGTDEFTDAGEPVNGTYEVWQWDEGSFSSIDSREISL